MVQPESRRCQTIFVPTNTEDMHVAHFWMIKLNWLLADNSGGTKIYRNEVELARLSSKELREPIGEVDPNDLGPAAEYWAGKNMKDAFALGLEPSSRQELDEQGFSKVNGVEHEEDIELTNHYYEQFGDLEDFGEWPPPYPIKMLHNPEAVYMGDSLLGLTHPWVVLNRAVAEMRTGRTHMINGYELQSEAAMYHYFCKKLLKRNPHWVIPRQYFAPELRMAENDQALSSSHPSTAAKKLRLCDVTEVGISGDELYAYLLTIVLKRPYDAIWEDKDYWDTWHQQIKPKSMLAYLDPRPVIDEENWNKFLAREIEMPDRGEEYFHPKATWRKAG